MKGFVHLSTLHTLSRDRLGLPLPAHPPIGCRFWCLKKLRLPLTAKRFLYSAFVPLRFFFLARSLFRSSRASRVWGDTTARLSKRALLSPQSRSTSPRTRWSDLRDELAATDRHVTDCSGDQYLNVQQHSLLCSTVVLKVQVGRASLSTSQQILIAAERLGSCPSKRAPSCSRACSPSCSHFTFPSS